MIKTPVLDACCGSKMFWFDRNDERAVFLDNRAEQHSLKDKSSSGGSRSLIIDPDIVGDFTRMPFEDDMFALVVFDPPHLKRNGETGWNAKKYGTLGRNWKKLLTAGFRECFRVLKPEGTLVFKWNEDEIAIKQILKLTPEKPLFGSKYGKHYKSHFLVFLKPATSP